MADYLTLLRDHVTLTCRSVDRIFLQAYVPRLQSVGGVCQFLYWQRGFAIPSSAAFGKIGDAYVAEVYRWAKANGVPVRRFAKGENKEQIARPLIEAAERDGGDGRVVLIGTAQEKTPMWRSWKAKGHEHAAHPHMEWGRQMGFVNHFYFYLRDPDWGGAFWKTNAYAPWPVWIWLNGHTWAQRRCERRGIGYTALDNGFRDCEDTAALQRICDRLRFNEDKTQIVHLGEQGFDFLGFNVRRYGSKLLIKPSKAAIGRLRQRLASEMRILRGSNSAAVIARLNPIIKGWLPTTGVWCRPRCFTPWTIRCGSSPTNGRHGTTTTSQSGGSSIATSVSATSSGTIGGYSVIPEVTPT
jgi:hypothetical protein